MIVMSTSIYYRGCCIFFKVPLKNVHMETNGCKIWALARRLWSQSKQGGHTCFDTGPRFLRSHPKDSLDPQTHRHLALYQVFIFCKEYLHPISMKTVIKARVHVLLQQKIITSVACGQAKGTEDLFWPRPLRGQCMGGPFWLSIYCVPIPRV